MILDLLTFKVASSTNLKNIEFRCFFDGVEISSIDIEQELLPNYLDMLDNKGERDCISENELKECLTKDFCYLLIYNSLNPNNIEIKKLTTEIIFSIKESDIILLMDELELFLNK